MPGFRTRYCFIPCLGVDSLNISILGVNCDSICLAHSILDENPLARITIYTEDAEAGFSEDPPKPLVLNDLLETISSDWYGTIPKSIDREYQSSVSSSWLVKALSIRLAERGANFLLHTHILEIDEDLQEIHFRGGGSISSGVHSYDELYDFR